MIGVLLIVAGLALAILALLGVIGGETEPTGPDRGLQLFSCIFLFFGLALAAAGLSAVL